MNNFPHVENVSQYLLNNIILEDEDNWQVPTIWKMKILDFLFLIKDVLRLYLIDVGSRRRKRFSKVIQHPVLFSLWGRGEGEGKGRGEGKGGGEKGERGRGERGKGEGRKGKGEGRRGGEGRGVGDNIFVLK